MSVPGIEKIGVYPGQFCLSIAELADARGFSRDEITKDLLSVERSVYAPWEDVVTMAVNAADRILSEQDRQSIGLLIAATETSIDQEKAMSSWIHEALGLPEDCRNFEIKHACTGMTDGIRMALAWLQTSGQDRKALVVTADRSLIALGEPWEPVNGGAGAAVLLSSTADVLQYEGITAIYTRSITDVIRPTPWLETGNSQESLYAYLEALDGALNRYLEMTPAAKQYDSYFKAHLYHTPFAGMAYRAHRTALQIVHDSVSKQEARADFEKRVLPAIEYNRRIGASYGASTMIALTCLLHTTDMVDSGDRLSWFSYGAGSSGEFFAVVVGNNAIKNCYGDLLEQSLDNRQPVDVSQYEAFERGINDAIGKQDIVFDPDLPALPSLCNRQYVLTGIDTYERKYQWVS